MHLVDTQLGEKEPNGYRQTICFSMESRVSFKLDELEQLIKEHVGESVTVELPDATSVPYTYRVFIPSFCCMENIIEFLVELEEKVIQALDGVEILRVMQRPFGLRW